VSKLSLASKEKIPFVVVSANATPLLAVVPLTQPCTSEVMSMRRNLLKLAVVIAMGLFPVAEAPSDGGGVL
jgi:nitrate reductase NapE component